MEAMRDERLIPKAEAVRSPGMTCWGWAASEDSEGWTGPFRTREDAEDYGLQNSGDEYDPFGFVQEGRIVDHPHLASLAVDLDELLERVNEAEECAWADDPVVEFVSPRKEAEQALRDAIHGWASKHLTNQGMFSCNPDSEAFPVEPKP